MREDNTRFEGRVRVRKVHPQTRGRAGPRLPLRSLASRSGKRFRVGIEPDNFGVPD